VDKKQEIRVTEANIICTIQQKSRNVLNNAVEGAIQHVSCVDVGFVLQQQLNNTKTRPKRWNAKSDHHIDATGGKV
jgi:hypothetical protein